MTRIGFVLVLMMAACGGDDDSAADGGPAFDAGPPDAPVATGYTAGGVFAGASAHALDTHADAVLFDISSNLIDGDGEMDPSVGQSFWAYAFASLSMGKRINVTYVLGSYSLSTADINPEGLKTIPATWMDSDEAMALIRGQGFQPAADQFTMVAMRFNRQMLIMQCDDPVWEIEKTRAEPGMPVESERWFALYCTSAATNVVCPPVGDCVGGL